MSLSDLNVLKFQNFPIFHLAKKELFKMSNREITPQSVISGEWIALFMRLFIVALNFDKIWKFNEKYQPLHE